MTRERPSPMPSQYSPVREPLPGSGKLSQLVSDHLVRHPHGLILFAIVDHEAKSNEVRHDSARTRLGEDGGVLLERGLKRRERGKVGACSVNKPTEIAQGRRSRSRMRSGP